LEGAGPARGSSDRGWQNGRGSGYQGKRGREGTTQAEDLGVKSGKMKGKQIAVQPKRVRCQIRKPKTPVRKGVMKVSDGEVQRM